MQDAALPDILDRVRQGVVVLNHALVPTAANKAAREMLALGGSLPPGLPVPAVTSLARAAQASGEAVYDVVESTTSVAMAVECAPAGDGVVVVLTDITTEQRAIDLRRRFVSHASHELKSPVAAVQALAEAVADATSRGDFGSAEMLAGRLANETERLGRLIADLLDLTRLEEPVAISSRFADVAGIVHDEVEAAAARAAEKQIRVGHSIQEGAVVRGDESQIRSLIRNLLDNAVRYTDPGGAVTIAVQVSDASVVLSVEDTGIGIPLSARQRIFERFFRVDEDRSRDTGGTGLGLAIVKHIAELHGGRVDVDSELGEGSTFTVTFPKAVE